ncbi:OLC1v1038808C2 [Oldenlandia corymbosa var. corymbosa]|nr:OLC1v1038808C2 [Oldenlandia corymbosa var. corymbosa]
MGRKRNKNKNHGTTGAKPCQDAESLMTCMTNLMASVTNMSVRLDAISSTVTGLVSNSKIDDEASGKSTAADAGVPDVVEFQGVKQITDVSDYQEKFEGLKDLFMRQNRGLSEDYLISSFLNGLKPELRDSIGDVKPESISQAYRLASTHEMAIQEMKDKVMKDRLRKGDLGCEQVTVISCCKDPFRFGAFVGEKEIKVLICPEVAHSLIDTSLAVKAGYKIEEAEPLRVKFFMLCYWAVSRFRCPNFEWTMKGLKFSAEMRIVEIKAEYDIILGSDWVRENNSLSISSDGISLQKDGKEIVLLDLSRDDV